PPLPRCARPDRALLHGQTLLLLAARSVPDAAQRGRHALRSALRLRLRPRLSRPARSFRARRTSPAIGCGQTGGGGTATQDLDIYVRGDAPPYQLYIGSPANWSVAVSPDPTAVTTSADGNISVQTTDVAVQGDGRRVT